MTSWARLYAGQELLSLLFSTLLEGQEPGLCRPKTMGHFAAANYTS